MTKSEPLELRFGALGGHERLLDFLLWTASSQKILEAHYLPLQMSNLEFMTSNLPPISSSDWNGFIEPSSELARLLEVLDQLNRGLSNTEWLLLLLVDIFDPQIRNNSQNRRYREYLKHCNPIIEVHVLALLRNYVLLRGVKSLKPSNIIETMLSNDAMAPVLNYSIRFLIILLINYF